MDNHFEYRIGVSLPVKANMLVSQWLLENPEADLHLSPLQQVRWWSRWTRGWTWASARPRSSISSVTRVRLWPASTSARHPSSTETSRWARAHPSIYICLSNHLSNWTSENVSQPKWWKSALLCRRKDMLDLPLCSSTSPPAPPLPVPDCFFIVSCPPYFPLFAPFTHAGQDSGYFLKFLT